MFDEKPFVPFAHSVDQVVAYLQTDSIRGLSASVATDRLRSIGANRLTQTPGIPMWRRFLSQFLNLIIGLLLVSAVIASAMGEWIDAVTIVAIVLLNGILGFIQEDRAEKALAALKKLSAPFATVIRDGVLQQVATEELVPGDLVQHQAGDKISADARLVSAYGLQVLEASLTGESVAIEKSHSSLHDKSTPLGDRRNMLYAGTTIASGKAIAVVVSTGMKTEIGAIAGLLQQNDNDQTPLQRRLAELGRTLVFLCLGIVILIFCLQLWRGGSLMETFLTSISLAVAAIPEGLPAVVTITLAIGLGRMAKRRAIIRKLPSVETLGCVNVICTDKTGTLTSNEMTVTEIRVPGAHFHLTGSGYTPNGKIVLHHLLPPHKGDMPMMGQKELHVTHAENNLERLLKVGAMCNNASWSWDDERRMANFAGDPTEIAILVAAAKRKHSGLPMDVTLLHENPFDSDRKMMSQVYRLPDDTLFLVAKGAPEVIAARCTQIQDIDNVRDFAKSDESWIATQSSEMAGQTLRVLALACRTLPADETDQSSWQSEADLQFLGLVGMMDPPRAEAADAVLRCIAAGIKPVMITGDHPATALAIAKTLQIANENSTVLTGEALGLLSDEELSKQVVDCSVYARVSAKDKLRVVNAWRTRGNVVAMTGDGVNDAPAIKAADIGIVMGITGTDVAKEASDMMLTDDNFATIVNAVEEGRGIYENIQKFLHYLLACNASEVLFMFISSLVGFPSPMVPIQILWINLVTDGVPALSLALEPIEKHLMNRPPRNLKETFLPTRRVLAIFLHGTLMALVALAAFYMFYRGASEQLEKARTVAFCTIAFTQVFFSVGCRSFSKTMPQLRPFSNMAVVYAVIGTLLLQVLVVSWPFSASLLGATSLAPYDWIPILFLSLLPVSIVEIAKLIYLPRAA